MDGKTTLDHIELSHCTSLVHLLVKLVENGVGHYRVMPGQELEF